MRNTENPLDFTPTFSVGGYTRACACTVLMDTTWEKHIGHLQHTRDLIHAMSLQLMIT